MMYPPVYETLKDVAAVKAVLGSSVRVYPFKRSPPKNSPLYGVPYAVHQIISGSPENYLGQLPDFDGFTTQIDAYGSDEDSVTQAARVMRDAFESIPGASIGSYGFQGVDELTSLCRYSFSVDWLTER